MSCSCIICNARLNPDDATIFDGAAFCADCLEQETVICDHCGTRIWRDEDEGDSSTHLCSFCYDRLYSTCDRCNRVLPVSDVYTNDRGETLCWDCYEENSICEYSYKPEPIFYGEGSRYLGVELEIDEGGELSRSASKIRDVGNKHTEHIYIKHDGSLYDGMEIVTHPMTLAYHQTKMPWAEVLQCAKDLGYISHKAATCGLHIHVNRSSFGETRAKQEAVIARILFFVENHWNELLKFSRRTRSQMEKWADRYGRKDDPKAVLDTAKASYRRYRCINLINYDTIEFRMFRGTLKYNTLIATLQLVSLICDVAFSHSDREMQEMTWTEFVTDINANAMPELVQYLKERRLYVNEPVNNGEEI